MPQYSVMLAKFPGNSSEHPDSSGWITETALKIAADARINRCVPWRKSDTPITMSRNKCVKDALEQKIDYLLMIDSDMSPDLRYSNYKPFWDSSWEFMLRHRDRPCAIGAPYCGPPPFENVYVFKWANKQSDTPDVDFSLDQFTREEAAFRSGFEEVGALPTGLILFDMRAFERVPAPWFRYEWKDKEESEKASTEDVYFTRNAGLAGVPQYVAWDSWAGHWKLKCVGKPQPLRKDSVADSMREALLCEYGRDEQIAIVQPAGL